MATLRYLQPFLARYRTMLVFGLTCAIVSAIVSILNPYILRRAIDDIQSRGIATERLLSYAGIILLIAAVDGLFKFGTRRLIIGASYNIERDLRTTLFERYMALDQGFYGHSHTGDLMARATNDLSAVRQFLGPGINSVTSAIFTLGAAAIFMFAINPTLALIVLLLLPLTSVAFTLIGRRMRTAFTNVQDQFGDISTRAQENFSGIRTIKAYAQEHAEVDVFRQSNELYRSYNLRYVVLSGILWPLIALIMGSVAALILLLGGQMVAAGTLTVGELVQFNAYLALLSWPMIALGWTVNLYQQAAASMGRLIEIFGRQPTIVSVPNPSTHWTVQGDIEFRDVGIRYDYELQAADPTQSAQNLDAATTDNWMVRHISFTVPRGSSLAIVGATGVGKTTLVNLLGRVRDPDEGQVFIDGIDIRQLPLEDVRRSIAYVPQETFLFSVPLRENVLFGVHRDELSNDELHQRVDRAVTVSRLSNDLVQFPDGIDTLIGERGVTLSGGQKQRTAIARAVIRDPAILVLDDALSSVDTHTAAEILSELRGVMRERTSIIIAQRIATVKDADHTIVLHDGQIVEHGTHRELIQHGGRYAAMYRRELLEAELEEDA